MDETDRGAGTRVLAGQPNRLDALDGLRGVAVFAVALFHYCYFWAPGGSEHSLVAYGDMFASLPMVASGYLGVHLFFVISGFVILLTLERTQTIAEFFVRRATRLWPALLLFGTATFAIASIFGPKELQVSWWEYGLSMLVIPPQHVGLLFGASPSWHWLDGAYWSLFVEIKFYCVVAIMYFAFRDNLVRAWIGFELFTIAIGLITFWHGGFAWHIVDGLLFQHYVPYFSFGLAAYLIWSGRASRAVHALLGLALIHAVIATAMELAEYPKPTLWDNVAHILGLATIFTTIYLVSTRVVRLTICEWSPLVRAGRASYGIYLAHQVIGVTILSAPLFATGILALLAPVLVLGAISAIAIFIFEVIEQPVQAWLKRRLIHGAARPVPSSRDDSVSFTAEKRAAVWQL